MPNIDLIPDGILTDIEGAKEQLKNYKMHYPFRKWCGMKIETDKGELWVFFDKPSKINRYARTHGIMTFDSISY